IGHLYKNRSADIRSRNCFPGFIAYTDGQKPDDIISRRGLIIRPMAFGSGLALFVQVFGDRFRRRGIAYDLAAAQPDCPLA
ncbi:hypothetical protein WAI01_21180, partial [Acinetobacter baumannii]